MPGRWTVLTALVMCAFTRASGADTPSGMIDLSGAEVVVGPGIDQVGGGFALLAREVERRSGVRLNATGEWKSPRAIPRIRLGTRTAGLAWAGPFRKRLEKGAWVDGPEGYRIEVDPKVPGVIVVGNDDRGLLFGAGRLLRALRAEQGRILVSDTFQAASVPKLRIRGHQLGYRPKTNAYDGWDEAQWVRYIDELAVFGTNAIELVPPRTDDDADSPHFPLPPLEMMVKMSRTCRELGLDVWVWFPVMDPVDANPAKVEPLLKEWDGVFRKLHRLDAVFVPGGDPGHIAPGPLFAFLEKATEVLHRSHPKAAIWVSPQGFDAARVDEFLALVKAEPKWLGGVVFGPQVRIPLAELRKALPAKYPIRGYPDITHSRQCQHPVPDWDLAFAVTEGREAINPRPLAMARLLKAYAPDTVGFISYSEGCNDDVNKFVWSALAWDPDADVVEVLRQYSRYFIGERYADPFAQALLGLERNWSGPLLTNGGVETTLLQLRDMERAASPRDRLNWRFQQALYRGYYDAYLRDRLTQESALEAQALDVLRQAGRLGTELAMNRASAILDRALTEPVGQERRARVFELGEALFQSIHMQLSKPKYQAIDPERGANLDTIDTPLNNRLVLGQAFAAIKALGTERERREHLDGIVNHADPGPGGFYDDLGDPANSPHLVREPSFEVDPMFTRAPFQGFALRTDLTTFARQYAMTFHEAPLRMRYEGLDPGASYRVVVTYSGDSPGARMRLVADGLEVHPLIKKPAPVAPVSFEVPRGATADGRLELVWTTDPGRGGNGRGCEVGEVWLVRAGQSIPASP